MSFGFNIGFEAESAIDSVVIIQYLLYFLTTLSVLPTLIDRWPSSYATSVRLEEILTLEDKIMTENNACNPKKIEIVEEYIGNDDENIILDRKGIIQKFKIVLNQHIIKVIVSTTLLTVSTLCIAYAPKVAGNTINLIASNASYFYDSAILTNIALLFGLYLAGNLIKLPSSRLMVFVGEEIAYNLRMELFEKLDFIDSKFIQQNSKGHIFSRLNNDLMNIREFVTLHVSEIFAQFISIFFVTILILTTDWRLSLIYLVTLPIYVACFYWSDLKSKKPYENHQKQLGRMMSYFERGLANRSHYHEKGFEKINEIVSCNFIKSRNISNTILPVTTFLTNISNITVYIVGFYFLVNNEIQLGTLLTVIIYGQLLIKPAKKSKYLNKFS